MEKVMRKNIRVCGVDFNVEEIQGGKLRATAPREPGFEFVGSSLRELRDNIPTALGEWDKRPTITVDVGTKEATIYKHPTPQVAPYGLKPVGRAMPVWPHVSPFDPNAGSRPIPKPDPGDYMLYSDYMRDLDKWNRQEQDRQQKIKDIAIGQARKHGLGISGY
jgi:hypothetical protein